MLDVSFQMSVRREKHMDDCKAFLLREAQGRVRPPGRPANYNAQIFREELRETPRITLSSRLSIRAVRPEVGPYLALRAFMSPVIGRAGLITGN
jgi:hypothetical protein